MAEVPETKKCQFCDGEIKAVARKCRHCGEYLDDGERDFQDPEPTEYEPGAMEKMLIPVGRSGWAIAAGYCGLMGLFPVCGVPFVIGAWVTGFLALSHMKQNPKLSGAGRAWFGIICGGVIGAIINIMAIIGLVAAGAGRGQF